MNMGSLFFRINRRLLLYKWRLLCRIFPSKIGQFRLFDGSHFDYPLKTEIGQMLSLGGFESNEIRLVHQSLTRGNIFFDIGANGGLFTVIAAKQVGATGHVYAFEPGKRELELLQHNITINNLNNVSIIDCAVSNKSEQVLFAISHDGAMNSLAQTEHKGQHIENWQTVKTITVDEFIKEFQVKKVDFVKIDVEGAESLVLEGGCQLFGGSSAPLILCEFCDATAKGFNSSGRNLWDKFAELGFKLFSVYSSSPDGKIELTPSIRQDSYIYENLLAIKGEQGGR